MDTTATNPRKPAKVVSMRARPETLESLHRFRDQIQAAMPYGAVTLDDALRIAVGSASAALANGQLHVALSGTVPLQPPQPDQTGDRSP
jgi:hypothetical protein